MPQSNNVTTMQETTEVKENEKTLEGTGNKE